MPTVPLTNVEVIHPIVPIHMVDKVLCQQDSILWRRLELESSKVRDVLRFRVLISSFDAFLTFLESNLTGTVTLSTPAIYPFGKNFTQSYVRIISYSGHVRELERFFRIDVTFEFQEGIA